MITRDEFLAWVRGKVLLPLHAAVELTPERLAQMWLEELEDWARVEVIGWARSERLPELMLEYARLLAECNPGHVVYDANREDVMATIAEVSTAYDRVHVTPGMDQRNLVFPGGELIDLSTIPAAIHWALSSVLSTSMRFRVRYAAQAVSSAPSLLSAAAAQRALVDDREDGRRTVLANIAIARVKRIFRDEPVPTLEEILAANQHWLGQ